MGRNAMMMQQNNGYDYVEIAKKYVALGNDMQAKISLEQAAYYNPRIKKENDFINAYENLKEVNSKLSIILVTYNQLEYTQMCIRSIKENMLPNTYEIIVVDNFSHDGTREWLMDQNNFKCIFNENNKGFPAACNQGVAIAEKDNDIFLLNNDTIVCKNSIYNMHMALYEDNVGAVGASSNNVGNRQKIDYEYDTIEQYIEYANCNNMYNPDRHQMRMRLIGFALMIRRKIWDVIGGMDEIYGVGNFEDDDLCLNILKMGYDLCFCPDAFIFHFGGISFKKLEEKKTIDSYNDLLLRNRGIFEKKWKIRWGEFSNVKTEVINVIKRHPKARFSVLEMGCGAGGNLLEIASQYPNAELYGIEEDDNLVKFTSKKLNVVCKDYKNKENPFGIKYDYVIITDVLERKSNPEKLLLSLKEWLKESGTLVVSLSNVMHISVICRLLHGRFETTDFGTLQYAKFHFTLADALIMLKKCGLYVERTLNTSVDISDEEKQCLEYICQIDKNKLEQLLAYQYQFICKKINS